MYQPLADLGVGFKTLSVVKDSCAISDVLGGLKVLAGRSFCLPLLLEPEKKVTTNVEDRIEEKNCSKKLLIEKYISLPFESVDCV